MAGINLITEWNPEEGGFLSFVVVNGIVGMQRAGGNEAEYFTFLLERAEYLFSPQSFSIFVLLNRRSCTIQKKKKKRSWMEQSLCTGHRSSYCGKWKMAKIDKTAHIIPAVDIFVIRQFRPTTTKGDIGICAVCPFRVSVSPLSIKNRQKTR